MNNEKNDKASWRVSARAKRTELTCILVVVAIQKPFDLLPELSLGKKKVLVYLALVVHEDQPPGTIVYLNLWR